MKKTNDFRINPSATYSPDEQASWIWVDDRQGTRFLRFSIRFKVSEEQKLRFHVSADHRFQLRLDGQEIAYGPDRSDLEHWRATACEVPLSAGEHQIEVLAWWISEDLSIVRAGSTVTDVPPPNPPMAQMSWCGGFLFAAEGPLAEMLNTGSGDWKVEDLTDAVGMARKNGLGYHDIGAGFTINLEKWLIPADTAETVCVLPPNETNKHGIRRPGWTLLGHTLPEQKRGSFSGGTFRARRNSFGEQAFTAEEERLTKLPFRIPAQTEITLLWDLGEYVCGYPQLGWSGGAGASIEVEWAESLYDCAHSSEAHAAAPKGNRNDIENKSWLGFGDTFLCSGAEQETSPGIWWRSGCFIRLRIRTASDPLVFERAELLTTEYPLESSDQWKSSDPEWDSLFPLLHRGLELCAHETWVDCPYYEQLMYTGDTRLHGLTNYTCYPDDRITRSAIDQFDASRTGSLEGLVAERYPSGWRQDSATYALMWVWMVRDFMLWRNDPSFVRKKLVGVRQMLERFLVLRQENGLLGALPGWPFIDWDLQWDEGCGEGVREGDSSIVNLHLVLALQAAAEIEAAAGEMVMATRWQTLAKETMDALLARYWDDEKMLLLDTPGCELVSEHAQVLALITNLLGTEKEAACLDALTSGACGAKCTIYFSFYLLEAFAQSGAAKPFFDQLDFWRSLPAQGFRSLPEAPGNTRSDCHGWGAHPLYHSYASIAGIRPASPGFQKVRIEPMLGTLDKIELRMPHPDGEITFAMEQGNDSIRFKITLPEGISGELIWGGNTYPLKKVQTLEL